MKETFIFVDFSNDDYAELIRAIYPDLAKVLFAASLVEMVRLIPAEEPPVIVVGLPLDKSADKIVIQLLNDVSIREQRFVFLGEEAVRLQDKIKLRLQNTLVLSSPSTPEQLLVAIQAVKFPEQQLLDRELQSSATPSVAISYFESLNRLGLKETAVNCSGYYRARRVENLSANGYYPQNEQVRQVAESLTIGAGQRGAAHLHRSAAVSNRILTLLNLNETQGAIAKNVAFLHTWEFLERPRLFTADYWTSESDRVDVSHIVDRSAERVGNELGLRAEQEVVKTIAQMVSGDYRLGNEPRDLISSAILTTDLVDRICWRGVRWDPRAVNSIMHRISSRNFPEVHPQVLAVTLKSLCEAVEGMGQKILAPSIKGPKAKATIGLKQQIEVESIKSIPLSQLQPGMRAAKEISTYDGSVMVSGNTVLDEDLIWRLWQLAAIRPIGSIDINVS